MSILSISGPGRTRLLAYALAIASLVLASACTVKAQTTWTITVDVTNVTDRPKYSFSSNPANAPNCAGTNPISPSSAEYLYVCPKDIVNWVAKPSTKATLTIFFKQPLLDDATSNTPTSWHHGKAGQPAGGMVDKNAFRGIAYEYSIGLYDPDTGNLYVDDPTIIVGTGGGLEGVLHEIEKDCDQLKLRTGSNGADAREVCRQIDSDVKRLQNLLK